MANGDYLPHPGLLQQHPIIIFYSWINDWLTVNNQVFCNLWLKNNREIIIISLIINLVKQQYTAALCKTEISLVQQQYSYNALLIKSIIG